MKFRFVLLGPDDDPNQSVSPSEDGAKQLSLSSRRVRYERSGPGMVASNGWKAGGRVAASRVWRWIEDRIRRVAYSPGADGAMLFILGRSLSASVWGPEIRVTTSDASS